jgi:hypothetical protein
MSPIDRARGALLAIALGWAGAFYLFAYWSS